MHDKPIAPDSPPSPTKAPSGLPSKTSNNFLVIIPMLASIFLSGNDFYFIKWFYYSCFYFYFMIFNCLLGIFPNDCELFYLNFYYLRTELVWFHWVFSEVFWFFVGVFWRWHRG